MKLTHIFEGKTSLSALDQGGARFIVKRVSASLEKEGKPATPEAIIQRIEHIRGGWSQEIRDHAIELAKKQGK